MLVMIATTETQGTMPGDYCHAVEGELVTPVVTRCDDTRCGCDRGFPGLASSRATTTAMVVDRPWITEADLRDAVRDSLERGGWLDLLESSATAADERGEDPDDPLDVFESICDEHVDEIIATSEFFGVGTVLSRRDDNVTERIVRHAA